jgi:hypothetical protein
MDNDPEVAWKHNLPVLEDACQKSLAEWRQKVGTIGARPTTRSGGNAIRVSRGGLLVTFLRHAPGKLALAARLKVGIAKMDITPPTRVSMYGCTLRSNIGTLGSLIGCVLAVGVADTRFALVSWDPGGWFY